MSEGGGGRGERGEGRGERREEGGDGRDAGGRAEGTRERERPVAVECLVQCAAVNKLHADAQQRGRRVAVEVHQVLVLHLAADGHLKVAQRSVLSARQPSQRLASRLARPASLFLPLSRAYPGSPHG